MWNVKNDTNELPRKKKQTHRHGKQTCGCQRVGGVGEGWIGSLGVADANY